MKLLLSQRYIYDWLSYKIGVRKQSLQQESLGKDIFKYHKLDTQNDEDEEVQHVGLNKRLLNNIIFNKLNNYQQANQQGYRMSAFPFYNKFSNFRSLSHDERNLALKPLKGRVILKYRREFIPQHKFSL